MIVSCPTCGAQYKHPAPSARKRARCGSCASPVDLTPGPTYRIVDVPGGEREPALVAAGAGPYVAAPVAAAGRRIAPVGTTWDESESLPDIPEMAGDESGLGPDGPDALGGGRLGGAIDPPGFEAFASSSRSEAGIALYAFWAAGGAIVGTGASWTLGGTTLVGVVAGALFGTLAAWGFVRWTSRP